MYHITCNNNISILYVQHSLKNYLGAGSRRFRAKIRFQTKNKMISIHYEDIRKV